MISDNSGRAKDTLTSPWRLILEARRCVSWPIIACYFAIKGIPIHAEWRVYGRPIIQRCRGSSISIGRDFVLRSLPTSNPLGPFRPAILSTRRHGAEILIGNRVGITGGTLSATESIAIGHDVLVGANTLIIDSDFHPIDPGLRSLDPKAGLSAPVIIEDDVFIGANSIVLKGVRIGHGSVIGAGSVVTSDVPAEVVFAGNPGRVIRSISNQVDAKREPLNRS